MLKGETLYYYINGSENVGTYVVGDFSFSAQALTNLEEDGCTMVKGNSLLITESHPLLKDCNPYELDFQTICEYEVCRVILKNNQ